MYNGLEITPSASVQEAYDDNVTYVKTNPISDAVTHIILGLGAKQEGKTESFSLDGSVNQELFAINPSFDNTAENFSANFQDELSKYGRVKMTDTFSNSENPTNFVDAFGRSSGLYYTLDNRFNLLYSHDLTEQLTANVLYSNEQTIFTTSLQTNTSLNVAGAGMDYAVNTANIVSLNYSYSRRDFATGPYATTNQVSPNLRHFFTKQLYLDLSTGVDFLTSFNGISYVRPLYTATLTNDIDKNTSASLSFQSQYTTDSYTQDLFNTEEVIANLTRQLSDRLNISFSGFVGKGEYINIGDHEGLYGASIQLNYDLTKKTSLNAGYSFSKDTSTQNISAYTRNTVFLGTTIKF